jgi:hypothetical protein
MVDDSGKQPWGERSGLVLRDGYSGTDHKRRSVIFEMDCEEGLGKFNPPFVTLKQ